MQEEYHKNIGIFKGQEDNHNKKATKTPLFEIFRVKELMHSDPRDSKGSH